MSELERKKASITATMAEIVKGHEALGLPIEEDDFNEAMEIIDRLERQYQAQKAKAWADRWP